MVVGNQMKDTVHIRVNNDIFDVVWDLCIDRDTTKNSVWKHIDDNSWEFIDPRIGDIIYPLADKYKYGDW